MCRKHSSDAHAALGRRSRAQAPEANRAASRSLGPAPAPAPAGAGAAFCEAANLRVRAAAAQVKGQSFSAHWLILVEDLR
eukprot:CAMPEP_0171549538 /NCGR_PEP_ID=MMETSP0960-20121227/6496_1 /TAXON_ID=87120 /ORGANISM="Aurantiochytrium limacinum, Strain ATCCMYA-1381" /LENGTH=79 /DNA_ID=CAMNT_0012098237 /DNA_START=71 /DNA_END=308 /DNA_ORIENTATION=-